MSSNGGWLAYTDYSPTAIFSRAEDRKSRAATIKSGQVLKALSFLESDSDGKLIAYGGFTEAAQVTFAATANTETLILGGLTWTTGSGGATAAQLATAWAAIDVGDTASAATTKIQALSPAIPSTVGTFSSGTLAGWETEAVPGSTTKVNFRSTAPGTNPTDLADTGTAANPTIVIVAGDTTQSKIAGVLAYDVNATSSDVDAAIYTEGAFWSTALIWAVDVAQDVVTNTDGTTTAVTSYNTGCAGTSAASNLLKQKFLEGSEFSIDIPKAGEVY